MADLILVLTVIGLGAVMFFWGIDKVWPDRAKQLGKFCSVIGAAYIIIGFILFLADAF
jgi:hypothetical protein